VGLWKNLCGYVENNSPVWRDFGKIFVGMLKTILLFGGTLGKSDGSVNKTSIKSSVWSDFIKI